MKIHLVTMTDHERKINLSQFNTIFMFVPPPHYHIQLQLYKRK